MISWPCGQEGVWVRRPRAVRLRTCFPPSLVPQAQEMSQLHHFTMVVITARWERARFCSEQTLHHWREGSGLQTPKSLGQHWFPEGSRGNQGSGSAGDWLPWVSDWHFLLCPSRPCCWGSLLELWGHCSTLSPDHCLCSAPLNDKALHWGMDLNYYWWWTSYPWSWQVGWQRPWSLPWGAVGRGPLPASWAPLDASWSFLSPSGSSEVAVSAAAAAEWSVHWAHSWALWVGSELGGSVDSGYWARLVAGAGDSSQDSAGTLPRTFVAPKWKWWQGGGSHDSGADSSPS